METTVEAENPPDSLVPNAVPTVVPRFSVDDENGYTYLEENGYVVFRDVATPEDLAKGIDLMWDFLEGLGGIKRDDISTWDTNWPDPYGKGIVAGDGVGQSSFLWFVRSLPSIQQIYSKIWATNDLITSFDGFCIHRPFEHNKKWQTKTGWYHLDQNGHHKPNKLCIQGLLNFYPAGIHDGGLVVVQKSHTIFNQIFQERPYLKNRGDFVTLVKDQPLWQKTIPKAGLQAIKICAEPGDFVLWDSRTIHCNSAADTLREIPKDVPFLPPRRVVAYVCMTPKDRLTPEIEALRKSCYETGQTTSHWPEEVSAASARKNRKQSYKPVPLTESMKKLIPIV